jgi:hypothetical protein
MLQCHCVIVIGLDYQKITIARGFSQLMYSEDLQVNSSLLRRCRHFDVFHRSQCSNVNVSIRSCDVRSPNHPSVRKVYVQSPRLVTTIFGVGFPKCSLSPTSSGRPNLF